MADIDVLIGTLCEFMRRYEPLYRYTGRRLMEIRDEMLRLPEYRERPNFDEVFSQVYNTAMKVNEADKAIRDYYNNICVGTLGSSYLRNISEYQLERQMTRRTQELSPRRRRGQTEELPRGARMPEEQPNPEEAVKKAQEFLDRLKRNMDNLGQGLPEGSEEGGNQENP